MINVYVKEDFLASQILQRVCPKEASLLNDPCMRVKVRLRYANSLVTVESFNS